MRSAARERERRHGDGRGHVSVGAITVLVLVLPGGCHGNPPGDTPSPLSYVSDTGVMGGGESGVERDNYKTDGACLPIPEVGVKGYRHHCGGNIDLTVDGQYNHPLSGWTSFDPWHAAIGFGPTYVSEWLEDDDVYETPLVAACCGGPFDFEYADPDYPNAYALNCVLDAVQQICVALPKYYEALGNEASGAKRKALWAVADHLNSEAVQTDCVRTLVEENDPEHHVSNRSWQIISDDKLRSSITIDLLEILEWEYPDDPSDVADCYSVLDNDDNVLPLVEFLVGDTENLSIVAGDGILTNHDNVIEPLQLGPASLISVVLDPVDGDLEIRNLVLRDNDGITIDVGSVSVTVDRWSLRLLLPVTAAPVLEDYLYEAGTMSFVASAVYAGDVILLVGTNAGPVHASTAAGGLSVQGLEVEYDDHGVLWTFSAADLEFQ